MRKTLLYSAFAALAVPAAAAPACQGDPWFERPFALWITDKTNPDEADCAARLAYVGCEKLTTPDAVTELGETRFYRAGLYEVAVEIQDGAATAILNVKDRPGQGFYGGPRAALGTYPLRRVYQRGLGVDAVSLYDPRARRTRALGNIFFIPLENLTPQALRRCQ